MRSQGSRQECIAAASDGTHAPLLLRVAKILDTGEAPKRIRRSLRGVLGQVWLVRCCTAIDAGRRGDAVVTAEAQFRRGGFVARSTCVGEGVVVWVAVRCVRLLQSRFVDWAARCIAGGLGICDFEHARYCDGHENPVTSSRVHGGR